MYFVLLYKIDERLGEFNAESIENALYEYTCSKET